MNLPPISNAHLFQNSPFYEDNKVHVIEYGDTIDKLSKKYNISVQNLIAKNPQINPYALYPGDKIIITKEDLKTQEIGFEATLTAEIEKEQVIKSEGGNNKGTGISRTYQDEITSADERGNERTRSYNTEGGLSYNPEDGTIGARANVNFEQSIRYPNNAEAKIGVSFEISSAEGVKSENGITTFTVNREISTEGKLGIGHKGSEYNRSQKNGMKYSYEVSMPEQAAKDVKLNAIDPLKPSTMPTGTAVKIDESYYASNEYEATIRNIAIQEKTTKETGTSLFIEKIDTHKVRITAGPTEVIEGYFSAGLKFDHVKLMMGRNDKINSATLQSAEFDLSTQEGRQAYEKAIKSRNIPEKNGKGISNVQTIKKENYESQSKFDIKLFFFDLNLESKKNTGSVVLTLYPDGTAEQTITGIYAGNAPLSITRKFNKEGMEIISARTYNYTIETNKNTAEMINVIKSGSIEFKDGPIKDKQTIVLSLTEKEMQALLEQAIKANEKRTLDNLFSWDPELKNVTSTPVSFATGLAKNYTNLELIHRLFEISEGGDGKIGDRNFAKLPGIIKIN